MKTTDFLLFFSFVTSKVFYVFFLQEQELHQTKDCPFPSDQDNFTSPLLPTACPSSPLPSMQQEQTEQVEIVDKYLLANSREEEGCHEEINGPRTMEVQNRVKVCEENDEEEKKKTDDEEEGVSEIHDPQSSSISAEEQDENSERPALLAKATRSQDPLHQSQRHQSTTGGPQISRWDKTIIEKIRSYYEAAAKAGEGDNVEEVLGEGTPLRRRNSFSEIPSGLVKESVSQFNVGEHQWEEQTNTKSPRRGYPLAPLSPEKANQPVTSLDLDAVCVTPDQKTPNREGSVKEEAEILDRHTRVCNKPPNDGLQDEEEEKHKSIQWGVPTTNHHQCPNETSPGNLDVLNVHEPNKAPAIEPCGSNKEQSREPVAHREIGKITGSRTDSFLNRNGDKQLANSYRSPSHKKTGRWSHHSRIASANRVLFKAMGSDVAGIGLFEASPVVDQVLIENSARILSRVQTLALMYSAKVGTMKVPLHQKQSDTAMKPLMSLNRPSAPQNQSQLQCEPYSDGKMENKESDANYGSHMVAKVLPQTTALTMPQIQTQHQTQNQTKTYSKDQAWDQAAQEKKIRRSDSDGKC